MDFRHWSRENPLYRFRMSLDLPRAAVAAQLGVSSGTILLWETGGVHPNEANMEAIACLLSISLPEIRKRWTTWYSKRPGQELTTV